ncbi:M1 family metallopeptidase, partial [Bacteroidia bacterium]|nr:M1 family metallopeptidase [Bacteroidia bacterium]
MNKYRLEARSFLGGGKNQMPYFCTLIGMLMNLKSIKVICLIFPVILLSTYGLNAQIQTQAEWQQRVNHTIDAKLNPETNILSINQDLTYFNYSPDELSYIYFHIWPEAFSNKQTPFGQESIKNGVKNFVHAPKSALSKISNISFSIQDVSLSYSQHEDYGNEVLRVNLSKPLKSGQSVQIKNTISIFIPDVFSRFGTNEGFYSMTQWYPKPAVYDVNGWNVFPYKGIGEYYSEYGKYKVSISLPSNYVVAATGELKTDTEMEWLKELAKGKNTPRDSNTIKTIYYEQDSIHDFAWFTARGMKVSNKTFTLGSHNVTAWSFIDQTKSSARGSEVVNNIIEGLEYYSKRVGNYPYKHCSAVIGPLEGAGGMEYPMITICESDDAGTIVHEIGHNWFQGLLGSNERVYPWMDESINTFYQNQQQGSSMKYLRQDELKLSQSNVTIPALVLGAGAH